MFKVNYRRSYLLLFTNSFKWMKEFVLEQKCIPWKASVFCAKFRNRIFNINNQDYWDKKWLRVNNSPDSGPLYPPVFDKIVQLSPCNSQIVDIGCGIGILMERLKREKMCNVFGVDISKEGIRILKTKKMEGTVAKIPPIPLPSESFDVALATELLEHVKNPQLVLREMIRIVKPCGFLIISVPDNNLFPNTEREHLYVFTERKIRKIFSQIKLVRRLEIIKVKGKEKKHYRIIARAQKCQK